MKLFRSFARQKHRRGFNLVEAALSIGILSFGFLALAPLLGLGLNHARLARENRTTAQIAATLIEEARAGTLGAQPLYLDSAGNACGSAGAAFVATNSLSGVEPGANGGSSTSAPLTRVTLWVVPMGPGALRTYSDVFPTPQ
jgi:type II secretory pathway pseudopilin PulG